MSYAMPGLSTIKGIFAGKYSSISVFGLLTGHGQLKKASKTSQETALEASRHQSSVDWAFRLLIRNRQYKRTLTELRSKQPHTFT